MQILNKRWIKITIPVVICLICTATILIPWLTRAEETDSGDYKATWITYANDDHLTITSDSTDYTKESLTFTGYTNRNPFECALTDPGTNIQNEFINFTVDRSKQNAHSCSGAGFLVNVNPKTGMGYFVAMYEDKLFLIRSDYQFRTHEGRAPYPNASFNIYNNGFPNHPLLVRGLNSGDVPCYKTCPVCGESYGYTWSIPMAGPQSDTGSPLRLIEYGDSQTYRYSHVKYKGDEPKWVTDYTDENGSHGHYEYEGVEEDHRDYAEGTLPYAYTGRVHGCVCSIPDTNIINISIQATQNRLKIIANNNEVADWELIPTGGSLFGPAVQWGNHNCGIISSVTYSHIQVGINKVAPVADFDYNYSSASTKQKIVVNYSARDLNNPPSELTYLWSVTKDGDEIATDVPTPINYNSYGPGHYVTTLKVKNKYGLFAPLVTKELDLVATPEISITPINATIKPGELAKFKVDNWYNASIKTTDVTIKVDFSDNLVDPAVALVGASSFTLVDPVDGFATSNLLADVTFNYSDGKSYKLTDVSIPPSGKTIVNDSKSDKLKKIENITVIYKQLPPLASLNTNTYLTYTASTSKELASYYVGGGSPRRYEINTVATCEVQSYVDPDSILSALDKAKITLIEKTGIFTLNGTIDGNGAMVELPACNTDFYLSGFTVGGGTISQFVQVKDGKSSEVAVPFGEYRLEEAEDFTLGYYNVEPISFKVNDSGVVAIGDAKIDNSKDIQFVKKLKVGKVNIHRAYEGDKNAFMCKDNIGTYEAVLSGTPIAYTASLSYDFSSLGEDMTYYYGDNAEIILPIGSYLVKEKQSNEMFSLKDIYVSEQSAWNCFTNIDSNYKKGRASFSLSDKDSVPVVLNFTSNGVVYDAYTEEGMIVSFGAYVKSQDGNDVAETDKELVLVEPSDYNYAIKLKNISTDDDYCAIIENGQIKSFKYLNSGTYEIQCSNNMYMDFDKLEEINSEDIKFYKKGSKHFLTIPTGPVEGTYSEDIAMTDWRGYSSVSPKLASFEPEIITSVSLKVLACDQDGHPVPNAAFSVYDDKDNLVYFIYRNGKLYPANASDPNAVSTFTTDESGEFVIYNFPTGRYKIIGTETDELFPINQSKTVTIDGESNISLKMEYCKWDTMSLPLSINLDLQKDKIFAGDVMQAVFSSYPPSSYREVSFTSDDESIVTISDDGVIKGIGVGKTKVRAFSPKDGSILCEKNIEVYAPEVSALTCNPQSLSLDVGESFKPEITYSPSTVASPTIEYSSSNPNVVSVSSNGTLTAKSKGTATITFRNGEQTTSCFVTVAEKIIPVESIALNKDDIFLVYNDPDLSSFKLSVAFTPADASDMSCIYSSSNPDIISVSQDGIITAHSTGTAAVTVETPNGCSAICQVSSLPIVKDISLSEDTFSLRVDGSATIFADLLPNNSINKNNITWESSNPDVASINAEGYVVAKAVGKTIITCRVSYSGAEDTVQRCELSVVNDEITASSLDISLWDEEGGWTDLNAESEIELNKNEFVTINTIVGPAEATNAEIEWTYSQKNIVEIFPEDPDHFSPNAKSKTYRLLANGAAGGEVTVTGKVKGTTVSKTFTVFVDSPGTGVHFTHDEDLLLVLGIEPTKSAYIAFDNDFSTAKNITWSVADESIATLTVKEDKMGVDVTAHSLGDTNINVEVEFRSGGTFTASLPVHVEELNVDVLMDGSPVDELVIKQGEHKVFALNPNCTKDAYEANQDVFNAYYGTGDLAISGAYNVVAPANGNIYEIVGMTPGDYTINVKYFEDNSYTFPLKVTVLPDDTPRVDVIYLNCYQNQISTWTGYSQNAITLSPTIENSGYSISISDESILTATVTGNIIEFHTDQPGEAIMTVTPNNPELAPFEIYFNVYPLS